MRDSAKSRKRNWSKENQLEWDRIQLQKDAWHAHFSQESAAVGLDARSVEEIEAFLVLVNTAHFNIDLEAIKAMALSGLDNGYPHQKVIGTAERALRELQRRHLRLAEKETGPLYWAKINHRVIMSVGGLVSGLIREMKVAALAHLPPPLPPRIPITPALKAERRRIIKDYRSRHDISVDRLAREAGMSSSAISGIVNENSKKFSKQTQTRLLNLLA